MADEVVVLDEALGVVGDHDIARLEPLDQLEERRLRQMALVVGGASPVGGDAGDIGDVRRPLVVEDEVEHEVVGAVGMLVVRRVEVGDVHLADLFGCGQGVLLQHMHVALEVGEERQPELDVTEDARQRVAPRATKLANALAVLVEALEDARRVVVDARAIEQRPQKERLQRRRQLRDLLTRRVDELRVARGVEDALVRLDVLVVQGRIELRDEAAAQIRLDAAVQQLQRHLQLRLVYRAPVRQIALVDDAAVGLQVIHPQRARMTLQIARDHTAAREHVEHRQLVLVQRTAGTGDALADEAQQGTLVPQIGDDLLRQVAPALPAPT